MKNASTRLNLGGLWMCVPAIFLAWALHDLMIGLSGQGCLTLVCLGAAVSGWLTWMSPHA